MTKQEIINEASKLPEYERKQIAIVLLSSMLTDMAYDETLEMIQQVCLAEVNQS